MSETSCYSSTCKVGQPCYSFVCPRKEQHEDVPPVGKRDAIERPWTPSYSVTTQGPAEAETPAATEDVEEIEQGSFLLETDLLDSSSPHAEDISASVKDLVGVDELVSSQVCK